MSFSVFPSGTTAIATVIFTNIAVHQGERGNDTLGLPASHHGAGKFGFISDDKNRGLL